MDQQTAHTGCFPAQIKKFAWAAALLSLAFSLVLIRLLRFAAGDDLHSYILLMPAVCVYLAWLQKKELPHVSSPAKVPGAIFFAAGLAVLGWHQIAHGAALADNLAQTTLAFVLLLTGAGFGSWAGR